MKRSEYVLPKLNVDKILALSKCPKCVSVLVDRNKSIEYSIYQYVNYGAKITQIAEDVEAESYINVLYWLKRYKVYEKDTFELKQKRYRFKRTKKFCREAKELYDSGIKNYEAIARKLNCHASTITQIARDNGWAHENYYRTFDWIVPKEIPENNINNYKQYKLMIYHFTKKMVERHFSLKERSKLKKHFRIRFKGKQRIEICEVDHIVSVFDAYNRGVNPLPWQLVCHPANLQIITRQENLVKGRCSYLNPKELLERIEKFEKENGKVKLPIEAPKIPKYTLRWKR